MYDDVILSTSIDLDLQPKPNRSVVISWPSVYTFFQVLGENSISIDIDQWKGVSFW